MAPKSLGIMTRADVTGFRAKARSLGRARIPGVVTLIGMLLFMLPLVVLPGNDDASALPQTVLFQAGVSLLWVVRLTVRARALREPGVARPLLVLLGWAALSLLWATDAGTGSQVLWRWSAAVALFLLVADEIESAAPARALLTCVFAAGALVSAVGLLQQITGFDVVPQAFPPAGTLANKNVAAGFVVVTLPLGLALAAGAVAAWQSALFSAASGASLAYLVHADCRGAFLALAAEVVVALAVLTWRGHRAAWTPRHLVALAPGLVVFGLLSWTPAPQSAEADPSRRSETARLASQADERAARSVAIRFGVWRNTLELIREQPLRGVGLAGFRTEYPRVAGRFVSDGTDIDQRVESAHNDYLQGLAELGLPGVLLMLWILVAGARAAALAPHPDPPAGTLSLVLVCACAFVGLLVQAAFSPTFDQPALLAAASAIGGVAVGLTSRSGSLSRRPASPAWIRALRPELALAACALVMASGSGVREIVADRHGLAMARASARQDWPVVVSEGLEARRWNAARADLGFPMGIALLRLGRAEEAARVFEELTSVDPFNPNALGNLAIALERTGDRARAAAVFERVRALRPDDAGARDGLLRLASISPSPRRAVQ